MSASSVRAEVWQATAAAGTSRVVPDGCMDLILIEGQIIVAGPDTRAHTVPSLTSAVCGIRFAPGVLSSALGVAANELTDARPEAIDVVPAALTRAMRTVSTDDHGLFAEQTLAMIRGRIAEGFVCAPEVRALRAAAARSEPLAQTERSLHMSERTLNRRAQQAFGYGPATLRRILRFRRARAMLAGHTAAEVAASAGYADEAHLSRDVRRLAGCTPAQLRRLNEPASG